MAKYTGANKQQQVELKRLHAGKTSAAEAAKKTQIDLACVKSFYAHFDKTAKASAPAETEAKTTDKK